MPGETYWALVSDRGHDADGPWVTVLGSHFGVSVDPGPEETHGRVYTTRDRAAQWQQGLPDHAAGKALEITQVGYHGSGYFKRHLGDTPTTERSDTVKPDPRPERLPLNSASPGRGPAR